MERWVVGVDEAGRGPLAGPVAVGVVMVPKNFDVKKEFPGVNDSKLLTPRKREEIYECAVRREEMGDVRFCVRFSYHYYIDRFGIVRAVERAVASGLRRIAPKPYRGKIFLDGLLRAPQQYKQKTIIGGDRLVPLISLASIIAKVRRDKLMRRMAKLYPQYGFELHKGYGTRRHWDAINRYGLCEIHRKTYCLPTSKAGKVHNGGCVIDDRVVEFVSR